MVARGEIDIVSEPCWWQKTRVRCRIPTVERVKIQPDFQSCQVPDRLLGAMRANSPVISLLPVGSECLTFLELVDDLPYV